MSPEPNSPELLALRSLWIHLLLYYSDGYVVKDNLLENADTLPARSFAELAQAAGLLRIVSDMAGTTLVEFTKAGDAALSAAGLSDNKALNADKGDERGFVVIDRNSGLRAS